MAKIKNDFSKIDFPPCNTQIFICVDPGSVQEGGQGIYMVDNKRDSGSSGEGSCELYTMCDDNDNVSWTIINIAQDETPMEITGFQTEGNAVFRNEKPVAADGCKNLCWVLDKAYSSGGKSDTYQIAIMVNEVPIHWDPFIACK